ncbi:MAG: CoA-transferase [bacterium]|nr:CoA-transferase [bacterium]
MPQSFHPEERSGVGPLFTSPDADQARLFFRQKPRRLTNKLTTARDAVARLVGDGDYLGVGGFGSNRIPTALLHEVVRQGRRQLGLAGHTATHDCQILIAGDCVDRCDVAYVVGLEARGLSRNARRAFEEGRVQVTEWTNAALAWRYRAAAMGVPFLPARIMLGTDTARYSAAREIRCPFTGIRLVALPALFPDVALIHVHRADVYGNCQIEGIMVSDHDLARAARRVIVSTERIIPNEDIRREPTRTAIPYYCVDAVVEIPYGAYPGNMPYEYFSDEEHLQEWLEAEEDPALFAAFVREHIREPADFAAYLERCGGLNRLQELRRLEHFPGKEGDESDR